VATNTNISTITGGEFFRMGVGQDGNLYVMHHYKQLYSFLNITL
jgi:hypothetical protein